jgi:hypothetical protein
MGEMFLNKDGKNYTYTLIKDTRRIVRITHPQDEISLSNTLSPFSDPASPPRFPRTSSLRSYIQIRCKMAYALCQRIRCCWTRQAIGGTSLSSEANSHNQLSITDVNNYLQLVEPMRSSALRQTIDASTDSVKYQSIANLSFNVARQSNRALPQSHIFSCGSLEELNESLTAISNGSAGAATLTESNAVIMCFGGQVSTFVGLERTAHDCFGILRFYLYHCNSVYRTLGIESIYPGIFQRSPIGDVVRLQTMLFAMQYSCAKAWIDCGVKVSAVVGHSFGELTALCVSGVLLLHEQQK